MNPEAEQDLLSKPAKPIAMKNRTLRKLKRLFWAEADIRSARELCQYLLKNLPELESGYIRRAIEDGIIISYARPFCENEGLGSLPQQFREFADARTQSFHERLLSSRDFIAAHNNLRERGSLLSAEASQVQPDKIMIEVQADGQTYWEIKAPNLEEIVLNQVCDLCRLQEQRLNDESCRALLEITVGSSYKPGCYTLGENFP
jgi:hypothetical protein